MNEEKSPLHAAGTMLVFVVAGIGLCALVKLISLSPLWSTEGAAWVQAIGSIGAIIAAIVIMKYQSEEARKLAIETDARALSRRLAALEALIDQGYLMAQSVEKHASGIRSFYDYFFTLVRPEEIEAIIQSLKSIPLYTLESYKLVSGIHEMTLRLDQLEPFVVIHANSGDVHYHFEGEDKSQVEFIFRKIKEAREKALEGMSELGYTPSNVIDEQEATQDRSA
jgi:hypothetical protein